MKLASKVTGISKIKAINKAISLLTIDQENKSIKSTNKTNKKLAF